MNFPFTERPNFISFLNIPSISIAVSATVASVPHQTPIWIKHLSYNTSVLNWTDRHITVEALFLPGL